jgi:hypothetical protein
MNSLSTLDRYLLDRWKGGDSSTSTARNVPRRGSAPARSSNGSPQRSRGNAIVPEAVLASTEPVLPEPDLDLSGNGGEPSNIPRAQFKRRPTGYPTDVTTGTTGNLTTEAASSNAFELQRRRRRTRRPQGRRVAPRNRNRNPEEGWMTAGFVGVLGLWSDLWSVIFGPDDEDGKERKGGRTQAKGKGREQELSASSASETESEDRELPGRRKASVGTDNGWVDPVTRAPDNQEDLLRQAAEAEMLSSNGTTTATPKRSDGSPQRTPPHLVSFQLGKKPSGSSPSDSDANKVAASTTPFSILTNSAKKTNGMPLLITPMSSTRILEDETSSESGRKTPTDENLPRRSPRNTKLLPAPLSVPLSTTSAPAKRRSEPNHLNRSTLTGHQPSLSIGSISRGLATTPFHRPKTLILDLDETLIHSTSRPMSLQSSGMGSGSGIVGISLSGLFSGGKHQRGGGGARGEGHVVEVILGGRSTLYHVYKRPYVDHFLKKVGSADCSSGRAVQTT